MAKVLKKEAVNKNNISDKIERGWLGLNYTAGGNYGTIYEDKRADFQFPQSIKTFQYMAQDSTIAASNNILDIMIGKLDWFFEVPDNATGKQKEAARFLNFCKDHMEHTWKAFIKEVLSYKIYGFHIAEKVFTEVDTKESKKFAGRMKWKKLPTRAQSTILGWKFDKNLRNLTHVVQTTSGLTNIYDLPVEIKLPVNDLVIFSYNKTRGNPEGHSPLKDCYQPWSYKKTIESYEAVNIAKNLGGIPIMQIDASWLAKAQETGTSEAEVLSNLETQLENLHAGEKTYIITPLAYTDTGKELFKFSLADASGNGGKDNSVREVVNGKQLEIMMVYLTDVLKLGNESHGSFALADSKNNLLSLAIQNHLSFIVDVIQEQLVPQTLIINGYDLPKEQYPTLSHSDLDNEDIDQLGKLVQRIASVNMLPRTKETVNEILNRSGFKYEVSDGDIEKDTTFTANTLDSKIFGEENESGAGEGMEEGLPSGTGAADKNNSATNMDNKA